MTQVDSERMREALEAALPYLDNSDSPGGCDGRHKDCAHCRAIAMVRAALSAQPVQDGRRKRTRGEQDRVTGK